MSQLPYPLTDFIIMHDFSDYEGMGNPSINDDVAEYVSPFGTESDITNFQLFGFTLPQYKISNSVSKRGVWGWNQDNDLMFTSNYPNIPQPCTIVFTGERRPFDGEGDFITPFNQNTPIIDFTILSTNLFGVPVDSLILNCGTQLISFSLPRNVSAGIRQFILICDGSNSAIYLDNSLKALGNAGTNGFSASGSMIFNRSNAGSAAGTSGRWGKGGIGNTGFFHHIAIHGFAFDEDHRTAAFIWHQARLSDGGIQTI